VVVVVAAVDAEAGHTLAQDPGHREVEVVVAATVVATAERKITQETALQDAVVLGTRCP
jgi:hypothetical protein